MFISSDYLILGELLILTVIVGVAWCEGLLAQIFVGEKDPD